MRFSPASRLSTRETVWVSSSDNAKNGDGRPSPYVAWGVPATVISARFAEVHAADVPTPSWKE